MNRRALIALAAIVVCTLCSAANVRAVTTAHAFWSFDTLMNGTGAVSSSVTAETFPGIPSRTRTGSSTSSDGGELMFTDFQGNTWLGSGNFNLPGHSLAWNAGSTGNSMTHSFSMDDLYELSIRMAIRSATTGPTPINAFTAIEYNIGSGFLPAASGAALLIPTGGNIFNEYLLDLSSLTAIENQANVQLRFTFGTIPTGTSFRVDNIQFTAQPAPEPTAFALTALGMIPLALRRRRNA